MERIGIRELRQHASRYLDRVKGGQSIEVTDRGRLVAMLVPPGEGRSSRDRLIASGRLIPASSPSGRVHASQPIEVAGDEPTNQQLLDEERVERL